MDTEIWVAVGIGAIGLVICSVLWLGRKNPAGKSYGPETAMGLGMLEAQRQAHGPPLDSGSPDAAGVSGDGGGSQP